MDNQSEVITISKIEAKMFDNGGSQYKITDTNNKKFKLNDTLKAGGETVAFKQFKAMGIKIGSTVEVWYKPVEKEYEGKPYTDNIIASFKETVGRPVQTSTPAQKSRPEPSYEATEGTDWDKIAVGKCQTNFLSAYIQSGHSFSEAKLQVVQARQLAELVVYGQQETKEPVDFTKPAEEPIINQEMSDDDKALVESIPF